MPTRLLLSCNRVHASRSRVLSDGFADFYSGVAVPKGHEGWLAYINEFIEEAKVSGLVNRMIETLALQGVRVAPPGR